MTYLVYGDE